MSFSCIVLIINRSHAHIHCNIPLTFQIYYIRRSLSNGNFSWIKFIRISVLINSHIISCVRWNTAVVSVSAMVSLLLWFVGCQVLFDSYSIFELLRIRETCLQCWSWILVELVARMILFVEFVGVDEGMSIDVHALMVRRELCCLVQRHLIMQVILHHTRVDISTVTIFSECGQNLGKALAISGYSLAWIVLWHPLPRMIIYW